MREGISWGVWTGWPSSAATTGLPCILSRQRRPAAARPRRRHVLPRAPRPAGLAHGLTNFGSFPVVAADLTESRFASTLDSECLKSNCVNAVLAWKPLGIRFDGQNRLSLYHKSNLNLLFLTLNRHFPKEDKRLSQMARRGKAFAIWAPFLGPM